MQKNQAIMKFNFSSKHRCMWVSLVYVIKMFYFLLYVANGPDLVHNRVRKGIYAEPFINH